MADKVQMRLAEFIRPFHVPPGAKVRLAKDFDPAFKAGIKKKRDGAELLAEGVRLLAEYQSRLAAQDTWGVLVVLQALDAAGKDGTIRQVMSGVNPQGVAVRSFALGLDQETAGLMKLKPRRSDESIMSRPLLLTAGLVGMYMAIVLDGLTAFGKSHYGSYAIGSSIALLPSRS